MCHHSNARPWCSRLPVRYNYFVFFQGMSIQLLLRGRRWRISNAQPPRKKAIVFYKRERTKVFTWCQQAVSSPASRGRRGEIGKERELMQWVRKLLV